MRNAGSVALSRLSKTQAEIARAVGVSGVSVHHWLTGNKKPARAARDKICATYGISVTAWDEAPKSKPKPPAAPTPPPPDDDATTVGGPFAMARELEQHVRELLEELRNGLEDAGVPVSPLERAKVMASAATTLDKLTKITGQHDLGRRVLKLPMFRRAVEEIARALAPFPGAAAAVASRLEELERRDMQGG